MMSRVADSTGQMVALIVTKSQPDPARALIAKGPDVADKLREIDNKSAQCYADLEWKTHRLNKLAKTIGSAEVMVESVEDENEDSLLIHIETVQRTASIDD